MRFKLTAILFLFSTDALAERFYGHFDPPKFQAQRIGLKYEMDYFSATGNYPTGGGNVADLPGTNSFTASNFHLQMDYDWSRKMSGTLGFQVGASASEDVDFDRSNGAIKGFFIGGAYRLRLIKGWATVIDAFYYSATEGNKSTSDKVSIGDGVNWFSGGMWLGKKFNKNVRVWGYLGIKMRSGGMSDLALYSIRPEWRNKKLRIGAGLEGFISVTDDKFTDDPAPRLEISSNFNGNSLRYFAVNPTYHEAQAWVGYKFKPYTEMRIGFANPLSGESTAAGFRVFATMETSIGWNWNRGRPIFPFKKLRSKRAKATKKKRGSFFKTKKKKKKSPFRVPINK